MRFRHFHDAIGLVAALCALAACGGAAASRGRDAAPAGSSSADARSADAATSDAAIGADAASPPADAAGAGGGSDVAGLVTCYSEGAPSATCTLPAHCCFSNYSSQHDGTCSAGSCTYGTIACDGPEDCAPGAVCCAHAITDPDFGTIGYTLACQTGPCGTAPTDREICHPDTGCAYGGSCVTAYGNDNDLPRTLDVCQ